LIPFMMCFFVPFTNESVLKVLTVISVVFMYSGLFFLICGEVYHRKTDVDYAVKCKARKEKRKQMRAENQRRNEELLARKKEERIKLKIRKAEEALKRAEWLVKDNTPVKASVVSSQSKMRTYEGFFSNTTYTVGQKVIFSVEYASGRKGIEAVNVKDERFKELSALLI